MYRGRTGLGFKRFALPLSFRRIFLTFEVLWARLLWPTRGDDMRYEITIAESVQRRPGGDWLSDDRLFFNVPSEAESAFSEVLKPYGHESGEWFLEKINYGRPPAAWAYVALPSEIDAADEIMRARDGFEEEIRFSPYTSPPDPLPSNFKPAVGIVLFIPALI